MAQEMTDANTTATSSEADKIIAELEQTPAGEQPVSKEAVKPDTEKPFHEHPRFKELIEEKNALKQKLDEMQSQIASTLNKQNQVSPVDEAVDKYVKAGLKEDQARLLAETSAELSSKIANQRVAPMEQATLQNTIDSWVDKFAKEHEDYEALQPLMFEMFSKLPVAQKDKLSSSPEGIDYLYSKAKAQKADDLIQAAFKKGVQEGYTKKQEKVAGSSSAGGSPVSPSDFSDESIAAMSPEVYKKNLSAILASKGIRK
jgi:hypothetical protein